MIDHAVIETIVSLKPANQPRRKERDYTPPMDYFQQIATAKEGDLFMDMPGGGTSEQPADGIPRFSVVGYAPAFTIRAKGENAVFTAAGVEIPFRGAAPEIIQWLDDILPSHGSDTSEVFEGGLVYLLSYEVNRFYENRGAFVYKGTFTDDLWCAFYPKVRIFDTVKKSSYESIWDCAISPMEEATAEGVDNIPSSYTLSPFRCDETRDEYLEKIEKIRKYIEEGDVYQVNLSRRLCAEFGGNPVSLYRRMRELNPAAHGAMVCGGNFHLLSLSPELFFEVRKGSIVTKPIKGTAPRGKTPSEDHHMATRLVGSAKDRAENLMIVDLMRNDLSRVCRPNSVHVPGLFALETLPTVHHLVSTIEGKLNEGTALSGILRACFPGGSVTGAPKIRAMEIISELETTPRGFYCGTLIARGLEGYSTASILIRTLIIQDGNAVYRSGGGITHDSLPATEYDETVHKAAMLEHGVKGGTVRA